MSNITLCLFTAWLLCCYTLIDIKQLYNLNLQYNHSNHNKLRINNHNILIKYKLSKINI